MSPEPLPPNAHKAFLWVRRGLPLAGAVLAFLAALLHQEGRGWWLLLAAICFSVAWPTFKRMDSYLRSRTSIMRWDGIWAKAFRPLARALGREDEWILSFCAWNNLRVGEVFRARRARKSLVLLPHCIQLAKCKADILAELTSCYDCGLCPVGDFMNTAIEHRWDSRITNRSHKAYREARAFRPDLIVAVSCTDRLLKGLTKLPEVPAFVLPLSLPHGMCVDTQFSVPQLLGAMEALVEPRSEPLPGGKIQPLQPGIPA
ncbi:MAG TPA: DUF116 domain-containing protein [Holophagaceae bacterium]|nr:DUF116 domain-containing protein [Holophagaceae bacterium]